MVSGPMTASPSTHIFFSGSRIKSSQASSQIRVKYIDWYFVWNCILHFNNKILCVLRNLYTLIPCKRLGVSSNNYIFQYVLWSLIRRGVTYLLVWFETNEWLRVVSCLTRHKGQQCRGFLHFMWTCCKGNGSIQVKRNWWTETKSQYLFYCEFGRVTP
jgi:hypothetical protein